MEKRSFKLESVTLYVNDLEKMKRFYQDVVGLSLIKEQLGQVELGMKNDQQVLLKLIETKNKKERTAGLYHVAYLLPSRAALGNLLRQLLVSQYPIDGASDHGYSEAIYLRDPEGNGIEIYRDKPETLWDRRADGRIEGTTLPMDTTSVLDAADQVTTELPEGTVIGHVHLAVSETDLTTAFYANILAFTVTSKVPDNSAHFYGKNGYHHQLAANIWGSHHLPPRVSGTPGLEKITVSVSETESQQILNNLKAAQIDYQQLDNQLRFADPNNINFEYLLKTS